MKELPAARAREHDWALAEAAHVASRFFGAVAVKAGGRSMNLEFQGLAKTIGLCRSWLGAFRLLEAVAEKLKNV